MKDDEFAQILRDAKFDTIGFSKAEVNSNGGLQYLVPTGDSAVNRCIAQLHRNYST